MKKILLLFLSLFIHTRIISQQFSVLYDYENYANSGSTIIKNDGYIVTHSAIDILSLNYSILISNISSEGDLLWDRSMTSNNFQVSLSNFNFGIIPTTESSVYWILGNRYFEEDDINAPLFLKIEDTGIIIDTVIITELLPTNVFVLGGIQTNDAIYLSCQTYGALPLLMKCNLNAAYLWHVNDIIGFQSEPKFISDIGDGIVIGGRFLPNSSTNTSRQYVRKFDYEGNIQWTNTIDFNGLTSQGAVNALPMDNGNMLFAATATSGQLLQERFRPMIGEIDDVTGDTLWTKKYFSADSSYTLLNFKRLSSGEYIGVGECWQPLNFPGAEFVATAFIMKLDSEYNLLWKRIYVPEGFASIGWPHPTCRLNDFVENEDGGITALGRAFTYTGTGPQSGYIQDSWLLRVDSEGCLVSGCAVDITEYESEQFLFVYPNPAKDKLNIQFPYIDKWQVHIYNMQGALVKEENTYQLLQHSIDIKELPAGVYTLLCRNKEGKAFTQKLMKQ